MPASIFDTHILLAAVRAQIPATSFLTKRYFPTKAGDVFATTDVLIEYKDGTKKIAPHVTPGNTSLNLERPGYDAWRYNPPMMKVRRTLTVDDLQKKGFGEAIESLKTPAEREAYYTAEDLRDMDEMITRGEEAMCSQVMQKNAITVDIYASNLSEKQTETVNFYADTNDAVYTPTTKWDSDGAMILDDLYAMSQMLIQTGQPAVDLVVGASVASALIGNTTIREMLDNRRYDLGGIKPEDLTDGAYMLGTINCFGPSLNVIAYPMTYTDLSGAEKNYIDDKVAVLTYPGAGRMLYGAVTQLEDSDGQMHTYAERRVPKFVPQALTDTREIMMTSRPLPVVNHKNCFIAATVIN